MNHNKQLSLYKHVPIKPGRFAVLGILIFCIIFPFVFSLAMKKGIDHDEHQFVASGVLLARQGLLPYIDYPYNQLSYLVFLYGALFSFSDYLLLSARTFSALFASLSLTLIVVTGLVLANKLPIRQNLFLSLCALIIVGVNPVFTHVTGHAWNLDSAMFFALTAFILHWHSIIKNKKTIFLICGILLGISSGLRLTYGPLVLPFLLMIFFPGLSQKNKLQWQRAFLFCAGLALALVPTFWLAGLAPERFFFGNFQYPVLYATFAESINYTRAVTLSGKGQWLITDVLSHPVNALSLFLLSLLLCRYLATTDKTGTHGVGVRFLLYCLPFLFFGAFAPTPTYTNHIYVLVPFLLLSGIVLTSFLLVKSRSNKLWIIPSFGLLSLFALIYEGDTFRTISILSNPAQWYPVKAHQTGIKINNTAPIKKVLTLAPIYPLEGTLPIYQEFATGPFTWRIASLVSDKEKRKRLGLVGKINFEHFFNAEKPSTILVGYENREEKSIKNLAKKLEYHSIKLHGLKKLFIAAETLKPDHS